MARGRAPGRDGVDGRASRDPPGAAEHVAAGEERHSARHVLHARNRPARTCRRSGEGADLGLCAGCRLPRRGQEGAQGARPLAGCRRHAAGLRARAQGVRRHRAGDGKAARRGRGDRLARQAHQSGQPRTRLVAVSRRDLHHAALSARPAARGPLRLVPRVPGRLPDRRLPNALPSRCAPLHLVSDHRAEGCDPARVPRGDRQPHLWLRRLPGGVPVEQASPGPPRATCAFAPREDLAAPELADLLELDDAAFRRKFAGSPIKRIGRDRFIRNCLIAAGNSGNPALAATGPRDSLDDPDPVVAEAAQWASARL